MNLNLFQHSARLVEVCKYSWTCELITCCKHLYVLSRFNILMHSYPFMHICICGYIHAYVLESQHWNIEPYITFIFMRSGVCRKFKMCLEHLTKCYSRVVIQRPSQDVMDGLKLWENKPQSIPAQCKTSIYSRRYEFFSNSRNCTQINCSANRLN